ncbi:MAG: M13 family metallopeptidase [Pyrinomonadaceae bacterium]
MRVLRVRIVVASCLLLLSCLVLVSTRQGSAAHPEAGAQQAQPVVKATPVADIHGFDPANLDREGSACQDFNQFANGGWIERHPVPPAFARWGKFEELREKNQNVLHDILEAAAHNKKVRRGSTEQKVGDYYAACMDEPQVESAGVKPLEPEFQRVAAIKDVRGLQDQIARMHSLGLGSLFRFSSAQDFKNSQAVIAQVAQGGISLPDRDYYTKDDDRSKQIRDEYAKHVAKMFELAGDTGEAAGHEAQTVLEIERKLAAASKTRAERRDPAANYNKMSVAALNALTPHFEWSQYLSQRGLGSVQEINVAQPDFLKAVDKLLTSVPLEDWRVYLRWHLLNSSAPLLSSAFVQEDFNFNGRVMTGAKEMLPRWKRCVAGTDQALGEALGEFYVKKAFTPQTRARAQMMVRNLIAALRQDLSTINWMSDETRQRAIAKLDAYLRKIGYPDKWRNYEALDVSRGAYIENVRKASEFEIKRNLGHIGKPVDRTEWGMTPPTVNAYYNPSMNEIVFPAGIMQPPFFDPLADDAINYGGMGAVIGHEMTHGFDDQGARFDASGNLVDWWTPADFKNFKERTDCVVHQFDSFEAEPGLHLNGKLVVGESVADLGGLTVAYAAFKQAQGNKPDKTIDGFTPEQRFFLAWAQVWAGGIRPEYARQLVVTDPHPLARFRVNGPLSNMPQFAAAFQCKAGDPMVRPADKRCQIW